MNIPTPKRPWNKSNSQTRPNKSSFYNTTLWKRTRSSFLASIPILQLPPINGVQYANHWCADCWREGKITKTHTIDHIHRIKEGGNPLDHSNLQGLCESHHARKSANEGNQRYK